MARTLDKHRWRAQSHSHSLRVVGAAIIRSTH
jgi:hypothetical protein